MNSMSFNIFKVPLFDTLPYYLEGNVHKTYLSEKKLKIQFSFSMINKYIKINQKFC